MHVDFFRIKNMVSYVARENIRGECPMRNTGGGRTAARRQEILPPPPTTTTVTSLTHCWCLFGCFTRARLATREETTRTARTAYDDNNASLAVVGR